MPDPVFIHIDGRQSDTPTNWHFEVTANLRPYGGAYLGDTTNDFAEALSLAKTYQAQAERRGAVGIITMFQEPREWSVEEKRDGEWVFDAHRTAIDLAKQLADARAEIERLKAGRFPINFAAE